jgi:hypothetical protein
MEIHRHKLNWLHMLCLVYKLVEKLWRRLLIKQLMSFWLAWGGGAISCLLMSMVWSRKTLLKGWRLGAVNLLVEKASFVKRLKIFSILKTADLGLLIWGAQPYWSFPFSKDSLVLRECCSLLGWPDHGFHRGQHLVGDHRLVGTTWWSEDPPTRSGWDLITILQ